jgi:predicted acetyltransferase
MKRPLPDGTTHLLFTGLELLRRVASLVPPPRANLTRFHGVFAPGAKLRPFLVPQAGEEEARAGKEAAARTERMKQRTPRVDWAELLRRTFDALLGIGVPLPSHTRRQRDSPKEEGMSTQMADPHQGMLSFQESLRAGILDLHPVKKHKDLYSHFDRPAPGVNRLTYVRLTKDRKTVQAFLSCVMNGEIDGAPCTAVGYSVPEQLRNKGLAKEILRDVVQDQVSQAGNFGRKILYIEAVVDVTNVASQRVAEAVLRVEREIITDSASGRPAYRYTARFDTTSGRQLP